MRCVPLADVYQGLAAGRLGRSNLAVLIGFPPRLSVAAFVLICAAFAFAIEREIRRAKAPNEGDLKKVPDVVNPPIC
jgi:hypothetical protein